LGAGAVAGESGAQFGNLRAPLFGLADQVFSQGRPGQARGHDFLSQPQRRFG
jgi:hypothetical protein